ncbi:MAG: hypothetical protein ACXW16_06735 [Burkholderiaceae bacterium]
MILLDQDRFGDALPWLDRAVREFADSDAFFTRGMAKAGLGDWAGAEADFAVVLRKDPSDGEAEAWRVQCRQRISISKSMVVPPSGGDAS